MNFPKRSFYAIFRHITVKTDPLKTQALIYSDDAF